MFVPALGVEMEVQLADSLDMPDMLKGRRVVAELELPLKHPQNHPKYRHPHRPRPPQLPAPLVHPILRHYYPSSKTVGMAVAFEPAAVVHRTTIAAAVVYLPVTWRTASVVVVRVTQSAVKRPC